MNAARLAEIEALANAATPGPWSWDVATWNDNTSVQITENAWDLAVLTKRPPQLSDDLREADAAFIAAARTAVPDLASALREARELATSTAEALRRAMNIDTADWDRDSAALAAFDTAKETW